MRLAARQSATIAGWMSRFHETASQGDASGYEGARLQPEADPELDRRRAARTRAR